MVIFVDSYLFTALVYLSSISQVDRINSITRQKLSDFFTQYKKIGLALTLSDTPLSVTVTEILGSGAQGLVWAGTF